MMPCASSPLLSTSQTLVAANREQYALIRNDVQVSFRNDKDELVRERLRVLDFDEPENNHFLCVRELWVRGDLYRRRADIVGFVNGLPLLFIECKNIHRNLQTAFEQNYSDYRDTIPHLFTTMPLSYSATARRPSSVPLPASGSISMSGSGLTRRTPA